MDVTVAICTWNRAALLEQTLAHMAGTLQVLDGLRWELLIVDNNCTDGTAAVVDGHRGRLPIRLLREPQQGLAHARNLAVREARGEYIVWTDDDVLVDADWLEQYWCAFQRWPRASIFGGPIEPFFAAGPPAWLRDAWPLVATAYAVLDLGPEELALSFERLPYGANMAFRAELQRRHRFDARLGHQGTGRTGGEETALARAMLAAGAAGRWVPGARVRHWIPAERQTLEYLRAYYVGRGIRARLELGDAPGGRAGTAWRCRRLLGRAAFHVGRRLGLTPLWVRGFRAACIATGALYGADTLPLAPGAVRTGPVGCEAAASTSR